MSEVETNLCRLLRKCLENDSNGEETDICKDGCVRGDNKEDCDVWRGLEMLEKEANKEILKYKLIRDQVKKGKQKFITQKTNRQ